MDRHLSPTEIARRFGVSIKALRLYEQRGLLKPLRSQAGWRAYGPDQVARLHQILALKRLGLPLARIAEVLAGPGEMDAILALQEETLRREGERVSRALAVVRAARAKLASGAALSIDDIANLSKETVMTRLDVKDMGKALKPFADRHWSTEEKNDYRARLTVDRDTLLQTVNELMKEAQPLVEAGDHTCPAAQDLARRWRAMLKPLTNDAPEIRAKSRATWNDAMADPAMAEKLAPNREIFRFVQRAIDHQKALEK